MVPCSAEELVEAKQFMQHILNTHVTPTKDNCVAYSTSIMKMVREVQEKCVKVDLLRAHNNLTLEWLANGLKYDMLITDFGPWTQTSQTQDSHLAQPPPARLPHLEAKEIWHNFWTCKISLEDILEHALCRNRSVVLVMPELIKEGKASAVAWLQDQVMASMATGRDFKAPHTQMHNHKQQQQRRA